MKTAVLISGLGGQGVVSIGLLLAECAARAGHVTCLPEHGPEQRGGYSRCTIVMSGEEILSPMPKRYDYVVAMDEASYKKYAPLLNEGGSIIAGCDLFAPAPGARGIFIEAERVAAELGNSRASNVVLLGALIGASGLLPEAEILKAISGKFKGGGNAEEFRAGLEAARA